MPGSDTNSEKKMRKGNERRERNTLKPWLRLQARMAVSYVAVSVAIALVVELLLILIFSILILRLPYVNQSVQEAANNTAEIHALQASVQGGGTALNPRTTFQPGTLYSLRVPQGSSRALGGNGGSQGGMTFVSIPYIGEHSSPSQPISFALLIAPNGQIVASSYPRRYPVSASFTRLLPEQTQRIDNALAGKAGNTPEITEQGHVASVAQSVWSKEKRPQSLPFPAERPASPAPDSYHSTGGGWDDLFR